MIEDWISENIDTKIKHTSSGHELHICCPVCNETRYRLYIGMDNGMVYCHNCNFKGSMINLIQYVEGTTYLQASERFNQIKGNIVLPEDSIQTLEWKWLIGSNPSEKRAIPLPDEYQLLEKSHQIMAQKAIKYLQSRSITYTQIQQHKMGFCGTGEFINRIIIPVYEGSQLKFWVARAISPCVRMKEKSPSNKTYQWGKSEVVFNIDRAAKTYHTAVISEGIFDALSWGDIGVSLLGKELYDEQLRVLLNYKSLLSEGLYVALDADALDSALKMATRLSDFFKVYLIMIPKEYDDPNNYLITHSKQDMWKLIRNAEEFGEFTALTKRMQYL